MTTARFCLVLHGHLPWVLHHGRWPHGEDWLYEAASETWLPLLGVLDQCAAEGLTPGWTVGVMPILLEQLAHPRFCGGFVAWLTEYEARAEADATEFTGRGDLHLAWLAGQHAVRLSLQSELFERIGRSIPGALAAHAAAGRVELLSSNATHGFHPLILHDACARAQVRAGLATSERHFGTRAAGAWLPECAYRPAGHWVPPVVHTDARERAGVGELFAQEGVRFFFVDTHLITSATPIAQREDGKLTPVFGGGDPELGWRSALEPHEIAENGVPTGLVAFGRAPVVSEQVWSADHGYPGDGRYLEFHKRHGMRGLRYWKVTGAGVDLGDKDPYYPADADAAVQAHADHFITLLEQQASAHEVVTGGRSATICAPFDAELFGHWWAEGPQFLLEIARRLQRHPTLRPVTCSVALTEAPADKVAALAPGTWGANGDTSVWLHEGLRFYWESAYRAEDRFMDLWHRVDWENQPRCKELLTEAGRQLLMLQASDWAFVITTEGAIDYGMQRILEHFGRFSDLCNGVEDAWAGVAEDPLVAEALRWCRFTDPVFPDLQLGWWS